VHTRGNNRKRITFGNWSGKLFVWELDQTAARHGWRVLAYCLMPNHHHVVLQIRDGGLSDGMCELNGNFSRCSNKRRESRDHLFGKRFTSWLVEDEVYLFEVIRYVLLNPVRAGLVKDPIQWRASSMRAMAGYEKCPRLLDLPWILGHFDDDKRRAPQTFMRFVRDGIGLPRPVPGTEG
jgi:putative transposase